MKQYQSPTGSLILGTLERLTGRAEIDGINDDGEPNYTGSTEIFYDDQVTKTRGDKPRPFNIVYLDENGGEWTFDQLEPLKTTCPQCEGEGDYCQYCDDSGTVTEASAAEWHRQNDEETGDERLRTVL